MEKLQIPEKYAFESKAADKVLKLNSSEILEGSPPPGFIWSPFILPTENFTQTNAGLFLGVVQSPDDTGGSATQNRLIPPPLEGSCVLLVDAPVLSVDQQKQDEPASTQKKLYEFVNKTKQKRIHTALFFILDDQTHQPIAVGRLDKNGKSKCFLSAKPYSISMGYGRHRTEMHIDGKSRIAELNFPKVSAIRVRPNTHLTNIKAGDIIRIGRKFDLKPINQSNDDFPQTHFGARIYPDLYINADMGSHDLSVDEYLKTSFLVGDSLFQIELEPGRYVAAILRKSKVLCLNSLNLKPDSNYEIKCRNSEPLATNEVAYQFASDNTIFDVGFRPKSLITEQAFVNWTVDTPGAILLGVPLASEGAPFDQNAQDYFSLVYKSSPRSSVAQTNYQNSFSTSINTYHIPLKGMNAQQLVNGQVPFSEYVLVRGRKYLVPSFFNKTNVVHTNGAEISILEPTLTEKGILYITSAQEFIVRIVAPQWNSTRILEMYVNGNLEKRWILDRKNLRQIFSTSVKTNTYQNQNFKIKFVSYGESPLPNFLVGRTSFLPYAETREFCVSIDGKDECP